MFSTDKPVSTDCSTARRRMLLGGLDFTLVGPVVLTLSSDTFLEYQPHARYKRYGREPLNKYGLGPFCKFKVADVPPGQGLYAFVIDDVAVYVGRSVDLVQRIGPVNYGAISPANCFQAGQATNCKVNARVLKAAQDGKTIRLYVYRTSNLELEGQVISAVRPAWNGGSGR